MFLVLCLISIILIWIWFDYFKNINIFGEYNITVIVFSILAGAASTALAVVLEEKHIGLCTGEELNGLDLFLYAFVDVGMVEEFSKVLAFMAIFVLFRHLLVDPIDYIVCFVMCSLWFAIVENFIYAAGYGLAILDSRIVWPVFGHIFNTAIFGYGIIYSMFVVKKHRVAIPILFFIIASLCHGIYDYLLFLQNGFAAIAFIIYFLITVSIFSTILNNCLNFSPDFTYSKVIFPTHIFRRFLWAYVCIVGLKAIYGVYTDGIGLTIVRLFVNTWSNSLIICLVFLRLSRFRLIKKRWNLIKIEMPFTMSVQFTDSGFVRRWVIKGDTQAEAEVGSLYQQELTLCPISYRNSYFDDEFLAILDDKKFLYDDDIFYSMKVFQSDTDSEAEDYIVKAKTTGLTYMNDKFPIVAVLELRDKEVDLSSGTSIDDFLFVEWCSLKLPANSLKE